MTTTRPTRQHRGGRLMWGFADPDALRCDYALAPFDREAEEMDRKWGIDRLEELVSVETATKFGSAVAKLNKAISDNDPEETAKRAAVCIRGLKVMDAEAEKAGQPKAAGDYVEYEIDGWKFAVAQDIREWKAIKAERPDLRVFSLREVGMALKAIKADGPIYEAVKKHFPGAEISAVREKAQEETPPAQHEDEIPFG